jgi:hypothetical protein
MIYRHRDLQGLRRVQKQLYLILVSRTLEDRWPIGDIPSSTTFTGCSFSVQSVHAFKCNDGPQVLGQYHGASCLSFIITHLVSSVVCCQREVLKFSLGSKASVWEALAPLLFPWPSTVPVSAVAHGGRGFTTRPDTVCTPFRQCASHTPAELYIGQSDSATGRRLAETRDTREPSMSL